MSDAAAILLGQTNVNYQVAQELGKLGSQVGDRVAGIALVAEAHWARLAGLKVVAEVPLGNEDVYWASSSAEKQEVLQILASMRARFVVAKNPPACAQGDGWIPLGATKLYAYRLPLAIQPGSPIAGLH